MSESNYFVHVDPVIFPDPQAFKPERWIEAQEKGIRLDRYLVALTNGSRQCVGIEYVRVPPSSSEILPNADLLQVWHTPSCI